MRDVLAGQGHGIAGLRIAAEARRAEMQGETAETADLDALALGQGIAHHFQQRLDRQVDVVGLQVGLAAGEHLDQFGLGHVAASSRTAGGELGNRRCLTSLWPAESRAATLVTATAYSPLFSCSRSRAPSLVVPLEASDALLTSAIDFRPRRPRPWRGSTAA